MKKVLLLTGGYVIGALALIGLKVCTIYVFDRTTGGV